MNIASETAEGERAAGDEPPKPPPGRVARKFSKLARGFWSGATKRRAWLLVGGVLAFVVANLIAALGVNRWNRFFFDAIEHKEVGSVFVGVGIIVALALASAAASVGLVHMRMRLALRWRQWITARLIERWLAERRFYQLNIIGGEGSNPEYRIADDVRLATEPLVDFLVGVTNAVLAAAAFIGILWAVGGSLRVTAFGSDFVIPGYMVLAAVVYSTITSLGMYFIGRPLVVAVEAKNAGEARLRYELTRVRNSAENIALIGGDEDERARLGETFGDLAGRWIKVIVQQARMTWIFNGSTVLSPVVPLLLGAPKYLAGEIGLGELMQIATAFAQVQIALNWLADNAIRLAEWLASAQRVVELSDVLDDLDATIGRYGSSTTVVLGDSPDEFALHLRSVAHPAERQAHDRGCRRRHRAGREGPREGRIRNRQEHADPRHGGPLALGIGPDPAAEGRDLRLHAAAALPAARDAAACAPVSGRGRGPARRGARRGAAALRSRPPRAPASRGGSVGEASCPAARSSAWRLRGCWSARRTSSSWTNRPRRSTRRARRGCSTSCAPTSPPAMVLCVAHRPGLEEYFDRELKLVRLEEAGPAKAQHRRLPRFRNLLKRLRGNAPANVAVPAPVVASAPAREPVATSEEGAGAKPRERAGA